LGTDFPESPELRDVLNGLEFFLPPTLAEIYPYWKGESLDGFYLSEARKTHERSAWLRGVGVLISDQTLTPVDVCLRVSASEDEIEWMECRLGERGDGKGGMQRISYSDWQGHSFRVLRHASQVTDFVYKITFGDDAARRGVGLPTR